MGFSYENFNREKNVLTHVWILTIFSDFPSKKKKKEKKRKKEKQTHDCQNGGFTL